MTDPIAAIEALELKIRDILDQKWEPFSVLPPSEDFDPSEAIVWPLVQLLLTEPSVERVQSQLQQMRQDLTGLEPDNSVDFLVAGLLKMAFDEVDDSELDLIDFEL